MGCPISTETKHIQRPPWQGRFTANGAPVVAKLDGDIGTATCLEVPLERWTSKTGQSDLLLVAVMFSEKRAKDMTTAGNTIELYYVKDLRDILVATVAHAPGMFMVEVESSDKSVLMDCRKLTADALLAQVNEASTPLAWSRAGTKIEPLKFFL